MSNNGATGKHTVVLRAKSTVVRGSFVWVYDFDTLESAINFGKILEDHGTTIEVFVALPNGQVHSKFPPY